ncbi:hypothetical protein Mapa_012977 [Marchantia paleacea]|nr:hypothetical protein Mapa_012977 [Marchantia paleacea]
MTLITAMRAAVGTSSNTTSNSVFSSTTAAASAGAAPPTAAAGAKAAAVTPNSSCKVSTKDLACAKVKFLMVATSWSKSTASATWAVTTALALLTARTPADFLRGAPIIPFCLKETVLGAETATALGAAATPMTLVDATAAIAIASGSVLMYKFSAQPQQRQGEVDAVRASVRKTSSSNRRIRMRERALQARRAREKQPLGFGR